MSCAHACCCAAVMFNKRSALAAKKSNDLATFVEARLGKPSHLLEGDKLKQFLAQVRLGG